jgi:hypothetical protein
MQPTRGFMGTSRSPPLEASTPAWLCSRWGLPGRVHCCTRRWSLTPPFHPHSISRAVLFCGPFHGLPRPGVTRHRALWSADFPQIAQCYLRSPGLPTFLFDHTCLMMCSQDIYLKLSHNFGDVSLQHIISSPHNCLKRYPIYC